MCDCSKTPEEEEREKLYRSPVSSELLCESCGENKDVYLLVCCCKCKKRFCVTCRCTNSIRKYKVLVKQSPVCLSLLPADTHITKKAQTAK